MNYNNRISYLAKLKKETVKEAYARFDNSSFYKKATLKRRANAPTIEFDLSDDQETMSASSNGKKIQDFNGEELWNEALTFFKKLKYRGELPQDTVFVMNTANKGPIDISWEFKQKAA